MSRLGLSRLIAVCVLGTLGTVGAQQPTFRDVGQVKPQPITLFDNRPRAMRLVVMLDVSSSMEFNLPRLRAATQELFTHLRPDDQVRVGSFGNTITISPTFTNDVEELEAALPTSMVRNAGTPLWRGIETALNAFPSESQERRVVLVMSDGKDTGVILRGGGLDVLEAEPSTMHAAPT